MISKSDEKGARLMVRGAVRPLADFWARKRKAIREWPAATMTRICIWMLFFVGRRRPEMLANYITTRANELGLAITMGMLDQEGIAHCRRCPSRFGLRKAGGYWLCLDHHKEEKAAAA